MGTTMGKSGHFFDTGTFHIVMLGLDSAGKTTVLYRLKFDQYLNTVPTIGFNCEKVLGAYGKAKGVQFLVWDVGGQEKLRPLWRSYTRCTDGIVFIVDSVDMERMEEAKMELIRITKSPDNSGIPVLILANKQDLPGAREARDLEKFFGLHEYVNFPSHLSPLSTTVSSSTGNIISCSQNSSDNATVSKKCAKGHFTKCCSSISSHSVCSKLHSDVLRKANVVRKDLNRTRMSTTSCSFNSSLHDTTYACKQKHYKKFTELSTSANPDDQASIHQSSSPSSLVTTPTTTANNSMATMLCIGNESLSAENINITNNNKYKNANLPYKGWHIQPACAITGEGLHEGLEVLYDMILKRRKWHKTHKKKR